MTYVIIGTITPDFIIEFNRVNKTAVMLPEWLNNPARVDTSVYNTEVIQLQYTFRATDAEKYAADLILLGHTKVSFIDNINNITGDVWMTKLDAKWTSTNSIKPWEITVTLISDELTSRNATIIFNSYLSGIMIIDDITISSFPVSFVLDYGIHNIKFFPAFGATSLTDTVVTILLHGDGTLTVGSPEWYNWTVLGNIDITDSFWKGSLKPTPICPEPASIILNPDFSDGLNNWEHDDNIGIESGVLVVHQSTGNLVLNPSFASGWASWIHSNVTLITDDGFDDSYSVQMNQTGYISQTINNPISEGRKPSSFFFFAKGSGVVRVTSYYTDSTSESNDITIESTEYCTWGQMAPPCMPYPIPNSKNIASFNLEWIGGDFQVDAFYMDQIIVSGYIRQVLTTPIDPFCNNLYYLAIEFMGYYNGNPCSPYYTGSIDLILECTDSTSVTFHYSYSETGGWQDYLTYLLDTIAGKSLKAVKVIFYPEENDISCDNVAIVYE